MTFSITGRCPRTRMVGIAITTSSICVGARCPWVRAGVGAVSTQNVTDPRLGNEILDHIAGGLTAEEALGRTIVAHDKIEHRQIAVIDINGGTACYSGARTLGTHGVAEGKDCIAAGNLLSGSNVPQAMADGFQAHPDQHLATRLLAGLAAGIGAGGEEGDVHSAALLVAHEQDWPFVDLRSDWSDDPVGDLADLWERYVGEADAYVTRALDPEAAPSYGVPGDP